MKRPLASLRSSPTSRLMSKRYVSVFGYTQAKALVYSKYGQPQDVINLHSCSIAPAHSEEITVKFLASPINPADINQIEGVYPSKPPLTTILGTPEPSAVGGNEGVVEVIAVGDKVNGFKPGNRAIMRNTGFGTWRTHASAKSSDLLKIPDNKSITPIQAATISVNPCTAYRMLKDFTTLEKGDWFIQNGANSGVGRSAIQLGRLWGLKSINVIRDRANADELKDELKALGADIVVTESELADRNHMSEIKKLAGKKGVRVGLNCVGGNATTDLIRQLGQGGHLVTYGGMSRKPITVPTSLFIFKDIHLHGFWVSAWSDKNPQEKQAMVDEIFGYITSGEFKDTPVQETNWTPTTKVEVLKEAIARSGQAFGGKKQVFVFKEQ